MGALRIRSRQIVVNGDIVVEGDRRGTKLIVEQAALIERI